MLAEVATEHGVYTLDLDEEEVLDLDERAVLPPPPEVRVSLPRVVAAARSGSTVVAVVDSRPPLMVSHDGGRTWRESGRGLPKGQSVAIAEASPDLVLYAARNRVYLSEDGGRFWQALSFELPEIRAVAFKA